VSVQAAAKLQRQTRILLVGDFDVLAHAAGLVGIAPSRLVRVEESEIEARVQRTRGRKPGELYVLSTGPVLSARDRRALARPKNGSPVSPRAGEAQLAYIERAYGLVSGHPDRALVTAPVSKAAVVGSGLPRARTFLGHTEWLQKLDGARGSVMCFAAPDKLVSALVTTHLPLAKVSKALSAEGVAYAATELAGLLRRLGHERPTVLVCSLNPHAGESELLGREEERTIVPGIALSRRALGKRARVLGPVGAETAFRKAFVCSLAITSQAMTITACRSFPSRRCRWAL
jgi:4-hydroxythreonine-4-phosphate dehydrogenase